MAVGTVAFVLTSRGAIDEGDATKPRHSSAYSALFLHRRRLLRLVFPGVGSRLGGCPVTRSGGEWCLVVPLVFKTSVGL